MMHGRLIVIQGPTAVGKTKLAIELALQLNAEIISADSRQFYREMSIGTAKPSEQELQLVPHHFINNRSIFDYYSAGDFEKDALEKANELFQFGFKDVVVVGGSGLYIKALCEGLDEVPPADLNLRNALISNYETFGLSWLQEKLTTLDSIAFEKIDNQNPQRLMRAIELASQGGIKKKENQARPFEIIKIGLELPREELYAQINQRVEEMVAAGLVEEAKNLHPLKQLNALQTVGYKELFEFFEGIHSQARAIELIKQHTRNFAKRQITWFRADPNTSWFKPNELNNISNWLSQTQKSES